MSIENITENNRLIAEFMGSKYVNKPYKDRETGEMVDFFYWTAPRNGYPKDMNITPPSDLSTAFMIENFSYHKSFDWLMPVYHEIQDLWTEKLQGYENAFTELFTSNSVLFNSIQFLYEAITGFIEWYNQNK